MEAEVFTDKILKFLDEAITCYPHHRDLVALIADVKQTSTGTLRIETKYGQRFLIVMIEDNAR
jgi:hypothetical protein